MRLEMVAVGSSAVLLFDTCLSKYVCILITFISWDNGFTTLKGLYLCRYACGVWITARYESRSRIPAEFISFTYTQIPYGLNNRVD